jgi:hypothetical protein
MINYDEILKEKQDYYGNTEGSYHCAAEKYATLKMIEENESILQMAKTHMDYRAIFVIENRIKELKKLLISIPKEESEQEQLTDDNDDDWGIDLEELAKETENRNFLTTEEVFGETVDEIAKSKAFEFKVDYKPFVTNLSYSEYGEYGFEQGFKEGIKWFKEKINKL